jgi:flagellar hook protein FlgE
MSFQQGLSGLSSAAVNLEVIANNIANASTIGAKSSRAEFSDLYAEAAGGQRTAGIGSTLAAVTQDHTQGSISTTGRNLDLAINGDGYFQIQISGQADGQEEAARTTLYTRNGQFKTDKDGWIVTNDGARLLGYGADEAGAIRKGQLQELQIPATRLPQTITSEIIQSFNLDASDVSKTADFDPDDGESFNYSSSIKTFDLLGNSVEISTFYRKTAANTWEVFATANGTQIGTGKVGDITFNDNPEGSQPDVSPLLIELTAAELEAAANATASDGVEFNFGSASTPAGEGINLNLSGATQQAGDYAVSALEQDGYAVGTLSGFSFDELGILTARYTNGQTRSTGQLAIATFRNPQGLQSVGGNAWKETQAVGTKVVDVPGTGNLGDIVAGALEESNVDLTAELVSLITAQRTYQANAQSIKTQDQVTQTFLNMR